MCSMLLQARINHSLVCFALLYYLKLNITLILLTAPSNPSDLGTETALSLSKPNSHIMITASLQPSVVPAADGLVVDEDVVVVAALEGLCKTGNKNSYI